MLTIKSDDVKGRARAYESIIKREEIEGPDIPEGFKVLVKELQGLVYVLICWTTMRLRTPRKS